MRLGTMDPSPVVGVGAEASGQGCREGGDDEFAVLNESIPLRGWSRGRQVKTLVLFSCQIRR